MFTHENYIQAVKDIVCQRLNDDADKQALAGMKLAYGAGQAGLRGVTYYDRWGKPDAKAPFVEVCAFGQESIIQLAGTTIHELGHVLAGWGAGHKQPWHDACERLGLRRIKAAGTAYNWAMLAPDIRETIASLPQPEDGNPQNLFAGAGFKIGKRATGPKPCGAGIGTMGGKSRGIGSGSRLRKYVCEGDASLDHAPQIIRASTDNLACTCNVCNTLFKLA